MNRYHSGHDAALGRVTLRIDEVNGVATVMMDRPAKLNALTPGMYEQLHAACRTVDESADVRVVVLRGAGGAFSAGSDIETFRSFATGDDGVDYDAGFVELVERFERISVPTLAVVEGACAGAGLVLAAACDVRIAGVGATFGLPIARTLGNVLSAYPLALLAERLGGSRLMAMVASTRMLDAREAENGQFVIEVVEADELNDTVADLVRAMASGSGRTIVATRQTLARRRRSGLPDTTDLVREAYSSPGFRAAVRSFVEGTAMDWAQADRVAAATRVRMAGRCAGQFKPSSRM